MNPLIQHKTYLLEALALAKTRKGFCAPNPSVGCVLVKNGHVIAKGYHVAAGEDHAEIMALKLAGDDAKGAEAYVTLEPCNHYGKTPPCTEALIRAGIKKVYFGFKDPNPRVAEKSLHDFDVAGIPYEHVTLREINTFYKSYQYWVHTGKPLVTAKLALSLDGKTAGSGGVPVKITGKACDSFTHHQRLMSDAILTTAATINADDPQLNARLEDRHVAKRIYIMDRHVKVNPNARVFERAEKTVIFCEASDLCTHLPAACVPITALKEVIAHIGEEGVHDLWVEAGSTLFLSLLHERLLQRAYLYMAPKTLGHESLALGWPGLSLTEGATHLEWRMLGEDMCLNLEWL